MLKELCWDEAGGLNEVRPSSCGDDANWSARSCSPANKSACRHRRPVAANRQTAALLELRAATVAAFLTMCMHALNVSRSAPRDKLFADPDASINRTALVGPSHLASPFSTRLPRCRHVRDL